MSRGKKTDVHAAMLRCFRGTVAFGLRHDVGWGAAERLLKEAYAEVGCELAYPGKRPEKINARKIAELTGLIRQSVRGLLSENEDSAALSDAMSMRRAQRILWGWYNDERFLNGDGTPALLPLEGRKSFSELCRLHSGDGGVSSKLQMLLEAKAVRQRRDGLLQVMRRNFATSRMDAAGVLAFGQSVAEHMDTLLANSERPDDGQLYSRRIESRELDSEAAEMLMIWFKEQADAFADSIESNWTDEVHAPHRDSSATHPPLVVEIYLAKVQTEKPPTEPDPVAKRSGPTSRLKPAIGRKRSSGQRFRRLTRSDRA